MPRSPRAIVLVLDSVGAGELPDAADYGDAGSNTLGNVARAVGGLKMPNLRAMGLGNVTDIAGVAPNAASRASWGRSAELSAGKDTTTGHWEMMGLVLEQPFPTYPDGFPPEVMDAFTRETGLGWLGNRPASGTEIIQELGDEHVATGKPIVYTSADSVFQIATHEDVIPIERLYELCLIARTRVCVGEHAVGRIIARPFTGPDPDGVYRRTHRRRDYAIEPFEPTVLDRLGEAGITCYGIGKIGEIFAWRGICESPHSENNMHGFDNLVLRVRSDADNGFVFANLVDFDMVWGHRNDVEGYARGLEQVDERIPELLDAMIPGDLLIITADHGCDPTTNSTDHSREYTPLVAHMKGIDAGNDLGVRTTFADIGETVLDFYGHGGACGRGTSFLPEVRDAG
ncbi:MAG: phosphopentomutase [Actinobacteria bacterium HGW-Actinobacteria-10]|jgi:phosphopentomutase|nr:MAG: phosphopentomutase [Actinobacteria bacterium HGW-Actinobacteria-10]